MLEVEAITQRVACQWLKEGRRVAMATLVDVSGSAPLNVGASMLVDADLNVEGSVTGGCVEAALVLEAGTILDGAAPRLLEYGIADELAGEAGLMCGGRIRLALAELDPMDIPALEGALAASENGEPVALAHFVEGPFAGRRVAVTLEAVKSALPTSDPAIAATIRDARLLLGGSPSQIRNYSLSGSSLGRDTEVFIQVYARPPRMVIIGAVDFSAALAPIASELGYHVTICDPREAFLASSRYRRGAEVTAEWPDQYLSMQRLQHQDVVLVFTHDSKLDEPALIAGVRSRAGFVGALGSRRTDADRRRRLLSAGLNRDEIDRIVCPLGLDIGSATPGETAIAILAQLVTRRTGRRALPLVQTAGPVRATGAQVLRGMAEPTQSAA